MAEIYDAVTINPWHAAPDLKTPSKIHLRFYTLAAVLSREMSRCAGNVFDFRVFPKIEKFPPRRRGEKPRISDRCVRLRFFFASLSGFHSFFSPSNISFVKFRACLFDDSQNSVCPLRSYLLEEIFLSAKLGRMHIIYFR